MTYGEVALASGGPHAFTYAVPKGMAVEAGCLVLAPLSSRRLPGVVVRVHDETPTFPTRGLADVLCPLPLVRAPQLALASWLSRTYRAPIWECLCLLLPPGLPRRLSRPDALGSKRLREWLQNILVEAPGAAASDGRGARDAGPTLTALQERALEPITRSLSAGEYRVFLLCGVTGSGKTHVYLRAAEQVIAEGGQVVVLVSEIALTPEAAERFSVRFPGRVAVLHSALTDAQRDSAWGRIRRGEASLVIGPRSAVFAPAERLRLIVVDEEHEWTYKQEQTPRYHARAVAIARARALGACVVLSSATPDVSTYYHALRGRFQLLSLPVRYRPPTGDRPAHPEPGRRMSGAAGAPPEMPAVEIVDLRRELREGNRSIFSRTLATALAETFERGEQAILFLNRRGAATCVTCRDCGHTLQCRRCEIPFAFHRGGAPPVRPLDEALGDEPAETTQHLTCHRCNRRRPLPTRCPRCASHRIRFLGLGTQRVEQELRSLLREVRVDRWDRDAAPARGGHEQRWRAFANGQVDVLIGTQMVAKALDVPTVTLVGAVLADSGLYLPDFRAAERTFQLLAQVAGRAGRGSLAGRAIIQTYAADHYAIQAAARHDYPAFYEREIAFRRQFGYPPFRRLVKLVYSHSAESRCWREAVRVRRAVVECVRRLDLVGFEVLGPVPCFQRRVRGRYRWQVLMFGDSFDRVLDDVPVGHGWLVDIDPVSVL